MRTENKLHLRPELKSYLTEHGRKEQMKKRVQSYSVRNKTENLARLLLIQKSLMLNGQRHLGPLRIEI